MASPPDNAGFVAAGYSVTAAVLGAYVWRLSWRARRARQRAAALIARRTAAR